MQGTACLLDIYISIQYVGLLISVFVVAFAGMKSPSWCDGQRDQRFLPAQRYASAVFAVIVCLSVSVSVTRRYCIKTDKPRIMQTTPHNSPRTLVF